MQSLEGQIIRKYERRDFVFFAYNTRMIKMDTRVRSSLLNDTEQ